MNKTAALLSVNEFNDLTSSTPLSSDISSAITRALSSFYDAESLPAMLDKIQALILVLSPHEHIDPVKQLLNPCRVLLQLFLGAACYQDVQQLLDERKLKTDFDPHFVRDAPKDAPLRWLLDTLVRWQQENNEYKKESIMDEITRAILKKTQSENPEQKLNTAVLRESKIEKFQRLSRPYKLTHLLVKGTYKLPNADYRADEVKRGIQDATPREKEEKRIYPMGGRLYQLKRVGSGNNRSLKISLYSTDDCEYSRAEFNVTISGDIFAESKGSMGSRFDKEPFFAGLWSVSNGVLSFYNNFSICFAHDERSLLCVTRYFHELNLIGEWNPRVICALARQREIPRSKDAFHQFARRFEEYPLWEANENIMRVGMAAEHLADTVDKKALFEASVKVQATQLLELEEEYSEQGDVPDWLSTSKRDQEAWKMQQENPQHTNRALVDSLCSDTLNLHGFLSNAGNKGRIFSKPQKPAQADTAAGLRNDIDRDKKTLRDRRDKLEELRRKIRAKDRADPDAMAVEFTDKRPKNDDLDPGIIYFYPFHESKTHCGFCLRSEDKVGNIFIEGQLRFNSQNKETQQVRHKLKLKLCPEPQDTNNSAPTPDNPTKVVLMDKKDLKKIKRLALCLRPHENFLMMGPHELPLSRPAIMLRIKKVIQANVSWDVATAFFDEIRFAPRLLQLNNLLFNYGGKQPSHPARLPINHWDQPETTDSTQSTLNNKGDYLLEEDFELTAPSLQPSYYHSKK